MLGFEFFLGQPTGDVFYVIGFPLCIVYFVCDGRLHHSPHWRSMSVCRSCDDNIRNHRDVSFSLRAPFS